MRFLSYSVVLVIVVAVCGGVMTDLLSAETPHGRLTGAILTAESGAKLAHIAVEVVRTDKSAQSFSTTTDKEGVFTFNHLPVGEYRVVAQTNAHRQPTEKVTVKEGKLSSATFELQPTDPFLHLFTSQNVFTTKERPQLRCHGFLMTDTLNVRMYQVKQEVSATRWHGWLPEMLTLRGQSLHTVDLDRVPELMLARGWDFPVTHRDIEGIFREEIPLAKEQPLRPGAYLVAIEAPKLRALTTLTVTDLGLIVKASPTQALIYAVDISSGAARPHIPVRVLQGTTQLAAGTTDTHGLLTLRLPANPDGGRELEFVGRQGESIATASLYAYGGSGDKPLRVYTYTDRPVYRPGQDVYFKCLARELRNNRYTIPRRLGADVRVVDQHDDVIYTGHHTTNTYGSFSGEFSLPENALPGGYYLTVNAGDGSYEMTFSVAEYRKPEFEVVITPGQERYSRHQAVKAIVSAQYYYGAPVPNAEVDYYVTKSPTWYYEGASRWDEDLYSAAEGENEYYYDDGEIIAEGKGRTDESGRFVVNIPGNAGKGTKARYADDTDWRYTVHATVADASKRSEDGSGGVLVTQGDFRLSSALDDWVAKPNQPVAVRVHAVDYDGNPVPGARGTAEFAYQTWEQGRERLHDRVKTRWQADDHGVATFTVTPKKDGNYQLHLASADGHGNTIAGMQWLWVMGGEYGDFDYPYQELEVKADKTLYREDDTAQIVVNTKYAPQTALLTLEGSQILEKRLVTLASKTSVINVDIDAEHMPAVRASVCFLKGKHFVSGDTLLNVSRERKALRVEITSDKKTYQPGEQAVYTVKTVTPDGTPAQAEVSLGVVDESIYAIAADATEPIARFFYPKRVYEVETAFSFPQVYLSGDDKAGAKIRTRRVFKDTSFWNPTAVTDASGQATFRITMPDNLTTWRATCRAADLNTCVGEGTYKVVVNKPFLVRLETPRFFTQGDRVTVAAVAHNMTLREMTATIGLETDGLTREGAEQIRCRIPAGKTKRLEWMVKAEALGNAKARLWGDAGSYDDAMELTLPVLPAGRERVEARSGMVTSTTVLPFELRQDCIDGTQELSVRLTPSLASAMLGSLDYLAKYPYGCAEQTMSCFLPDVLLKRMLDRLGIENPALSKQLPKMVEAGLYKLYGFQHYDGGWGWWTYDDTDPWMTAYVLYGLLQAKESGFTVNENTISRGATRLAEMARGGQLKDADTKAYAAYVLALAGQTSDAGTLADSLASPPTRTGAGLTDWGRAFQARAYHALGRSDTGREVLREVWDRFTQSNFLSSGWKSAWSGGETWRSEAEYAAVLLSATCEMQPEDPRMAELVQWIFTRRKGDHWYSTRDTAFVLYGCCEYLQRSNELHPDMEATINVNGRPVATKRFTAADLFASQQPIVVQGMKLGKGQVTVTLEKSGTGNLYYTATLRQVAKYRLEEPVYNGAGLVIERSYRKLATAELRNPQRRNTPPPTHTEQRFRTGDVIEVTLTVRANRHFDYVMVEDMLPAGCEARERGFTDPWDWDYWWCEQIVRDERVGFPIRYLDPGVRRIKYYIYAQVPGQFVALPPHVFDMYNPEARGEGMAQPVIIRP